MKILVLGSGGREHAIAWKMAQSPGVAVYGAPGNPGFAKIGTCVPLKSTTPEAFLAIAETINADLTVVGPEAPLVAGVADLFRARGRRIVGPTQSAARLEGSKIFAKYFLTKSNIPTAAFVTADNEPAARKALDRFGYPVVLKADGLAGGKGVVIAHDFAEAEIALKQVRPPLVIEEFLVGEEVTFIGVCDGRDVLPLAPSQDHKAVFDSDTGPNTGGMGAYSDSRILNEYQIQEILSRVMYPAVEATQFTGFLYAGLMLTTAGPKVLEFNVRMGDPETQPLLHRMTSDFVPALLAASDQTIRDVKLQWRADPSVCVVMASGGYPGAYEIGKTISGIELAEVDGVTVFHAGTRIGKAGLETAGGRVLGVTASGADLSTAIQAAYRGVGHIHFDGMHYRSDIGQKGLRRQSA